jgi:hypothetical protein
VRARRDIGIASVLSGTAVEEKSFEQEALDMHVALDGPTAAAWLVRKHKRQIKRAGAFDVVITDGTPTPPWFRIAVETMRRRKTWLVVKQSMRNQTRYRLRWLPWGNNTRAARETGWALDG